MSYHTYPANYSYNSYPSYPSPNTSATLNYFPHAALTMGSVGAIVGGTSAAARNIRQIKAGEINHQEAVGNVIKEAAGAGVATAAATAVVGSLGVNRGMFSLLGLVAVATSTKYFWDAITDSGK